MKPETRRLKDAKISPSDVFSVGDKVGDYEIVANLKAGGMATLFLGKRFGAEGFSRHVAIKVVHEHLASDAMFVRMFVDEALLSSKIHHPNVVHIEELRQVDGRHFIVMEYVHGCALSTLLSALRKQGRTLSPELATYVAVKVAEGLHAAHEATASDGMPLGVVHRDVSPQNVLLAYRGHIKLIDFGVAKAAGRATQTTGGSLKGKIRYMSPEQAFGKKVDRRTDVYALGIVLWEMLSGRKAFSGDNEFDLLEQVRNPDVPSARTFNPDLPEAVDAVITKAMAENMDERFQSAQEMRKALAHALPSALALDDSDVAKLLVAVMGDTIRKEVESLPESLSGIALPIEVDDDALHTLTISSVNAEPITEVSLPEVRAAELVRRQEPETVSDVGHHTAQIGSSAGAGGESIGPLALPVRRTPLYAAVAAVLLIAGIGLAVGVWQLVGGAATAEVAEPTATPPVAMPEVAVAPPEALEDPDPDPTPEPEVHADVEVPEPVAEPPPEEVEEPTEQAAPRRRRRRGRGRRSEPPSEGRGGGNGVFLTDEF